MTVAIAAAAVAWFVPPPVADAILSQSLSVVLGGPMQAHVRTSFPPSLLTLHADRVDVTGSNARFTNGTLRAAAVSLRLTDVDLVGRSAGAVSGTLDGVTIATTELGPVSVERIALSGPSGSLAATATFAASEGRRIVAAAMTTATGRSVSAVELVPEASVHATVGGIPVTAHLVVIDGDLVVRPDRPGRAPIVVLRAASLSPFELIGVAFDGDGLVLSGKLTGTALGF